MCGRYVLLTLADFTDLFPWIRPADAPPPPRYNIAPTQAVAVVPNKPSPQVEFFHWGLVPSWAKDPAIGNRMINARAETLAEKPAFRTALKRRRCLIPAHGFYEWRKNPDGTKTPLYIAMKSAKPFAFAGLWDEWHDPGGSVLPSCTIITTNPNALLKTIHDRMPAILRPDQYRQWLDPAEKDPRDLMPLLSPYPAEEMMATAVSRAVNSPKNDSPECIQPMTSEPPRRKTQNASGGLFPE